MRDGTVIAKRKMMSHGVRARSLMIRALRIALTPRFVLMMVMGNNR